MKTLLHIALLGLKVADKVTGVPDFQFGPQADGKQGAASEKSSPGF
jgi:hypothetical protein